MSASYRTATAADAPALSKLGAATFVETFGHLYRSEDLNAFLENHSVANWREQLASTDHVVHLAEEDGEAIGFARLGPLLLPVDTTGPAIQLYQLYVLRRWHGRGVAQKLMDWAIDEARKQGAGELFLNVYIDNHRAQRFYRRYGFTCVGTYTFMVGSQGDEELILRLSLEDAP